MSAEDKVGDSSTGPEWQHLEKAVQEFVDGGNWVLDRGFRPTQGGWQCSLAQPLDVQIGRRAAEVDMGLAFDEEQDELFCRHCWTVVAGGEATERRNRAWFQELGYGVVLENDGTGMFWAELVPKSNPDLRHPKYGSGSTAIEAVASAAARWRVEQVGTDNARRPGDPLP